MLDQESQFQENFNVSRETIERLRSYESLLRKWNPKINLVAESTLHQIWQRHFADSAQIWAYCDKSTQHWLDLGSGGGFPGLIIAILAAEEGRSQKTTLVESDQRKAAFLRKVSVDLDLSVDIKAMRSEKLQPQNADVVSARAFAPLPKLLLHADRHVKKGGICLLLKGEKVISELTEARKYWTFQLEVAPSITSEGGVITKIWDISGA